MQASQEVQEEPLLVEEGAGVIGIRSKSALLDWEAEVYLMPDLEEA